MKKDILKEHHNLNLTTTLENLILQTVTPIHTISPHIPTQVLSIWKVEGPISSHCSPKVFREEFECVADDLVQLLSGFDDHVLIG
jgi:hypothetical protein